MGIHKFLGTVYELEKTENGDAFCTYMDYSTAKKNEFLRQHFETLKLDGSCLYKDVYKFVRRTSSNISVFEFKMDKKYWENSTEDGWKQYWVEVQDNSLIYVQQGSKNVRVVRTFDDSSMTMTITCEDVLAKKYFCAIGKDNAYNNEEFGNHCLTVSRNMSNFL